VLFQKLEENKLHSCPNCKSTNYAIIVWGFDMDVLIDHLVKEKKIIFGEDLEVNEKLKFHCNDCEIPWGDHDDK
jgi:hypothetical protein